MTLRLTYANVVATFCLLALVGGSAIAATKTSTKTINGCVVKKGKAAGQLRILSGKKKCKKTEKKIAWNQKGVAGVGGRAAPNGTAGTNGTNGASGADAVAPAGAVMFFALPGCPS